MKNVLSGFADEAGIPLQTQIRATRELGWKHIEMRTVEVAGFPAGNLHDIPEAAFLEVIEQMGAAGIQVHCFGSAIGNFGKSILKPFDACREEARRAAVRMSKMGTRFIRIMSYPILHGQPDQLEAERFRRLREIQKIFSNSGLVVVHENCGNYGGMGWSYSLKLVENVPGLKLVFDMGNCVHDIDYTKPEPRPRQSPWEFYSHVRDHIVHLHIKDAVVQADGHNLHLFPGEGDGEVQRIVTDLLSHGYEGALSIEPHMGIAPLFEHAASPEEGKYRTYVEYGKRFGKILAASQPA
jgi:sugar phosphate isomerase/epimerase